MLSIWELLVISSIILALFVIAGIIRVVLLSGRSSSNRGSPDGPVSPGSTLAAGTEPSRDTASPRSDPKLRGPVPTDVSNHGIAAGYVLGDPDRQRLDLLDDVFDHIDHAVAVSDGTGTRVFMNAAAQRLQESRDGGLLIDGAMRDLLALAIDGRPVEREVDLFGPPARTFVVSARPLDGHHGSGAMAIAEDVTIRRRIDSVRRDFVANISHELKSPVAAIGLLADMIVGERDPEIVDRLSERMVHESERMSNTIDDLLALANLEFAEDADLGEVGITDIVTEALERIAPTADRADIRIETDIRVEGSIRCDRRQVVSALHNLLDNAVKYSPESGRVELQVHRSDTVGMIEFIVRDEGAGIPRRDQDRIFERFYRVDRARSRATGGTGLGLTIVRHVADNHGGDVSVESHEGVGSTFVLRIADAAHGVPG